MLDDPNISQIDVEDWKAWFDLTEGGSGDGRYTDTKYCANGPRAMLTNEIVFEQEPADGKDAKPTDFWNMVRTTFGVMKDAHLYAIFKRCICLLGGKRWVYLRLPSEDPDAMIHTFMADDIAGDWLKAENKPYLAKYHEGNHAKYPNYDVYVEEQKELAKELIEAPKQRSTQSEQQPPLQHVQQPRGEQIQRVLPDTPQPTQHDAVRIAADADSHYRFSVAPQYGRGASVRARSRMPGDEAASSSSGVQCLPAIVKPEPIADGELARVIAPQEELARDGPMTVEDTMHPVQSERQPSSQHDQQSLRGRFRMPDDGGCLFVQVIHGKS